MHFRPKGLQIRPNYFPGRPGTSRAVKKSLYLSGQCGWRLPCALPRKSFPMDISIIALSFVGAAFAGYVVWSLIKLGAARRRCRELAEASARAEQTVLSERTFLANMSHDIRTPLNAIVGFASVLQDEELTPDERREYGQILERNAKMLLALISDILDISTLEEGSIRFSYAPVEIVSLCRQAIHTTEHTRQEGVEMRLDLPVDRYELRTDARRLSQLLINLLVNAGKFTERGSITLGFTVGADEVLFTVTDTGPGIPAEKREKVFGRFEKLGGGKNKKGTGLGLAICRQIAGIMGGRIYLDDTYTIGARFVFAHPLHPRNGGAR